MESPLLYTPREVQNILGVTSKTLNKMVKETDIPVCKFNSRFWRYPRKKFDQWLSDFLENKETNTHPEQK